MSRRLHAGRLWAVLAALALVSSLVLALPLPLAHADSGQPVVLESGHTDALTLVPNGPTVSLVSKEDVSEPGYATFHNPARIVFGVKEEARTDLTARIPQIGVGGYALPQTQDYNLLWPGFDSLRVAPLNPRAIRFVNDEVAGPGDVYLWETSTFGGAVSILGGKFKLASGATLTHAQPTHQHANWLFTKPGLYKLTFHAEVDTASGTLRSDPATFTFAVGTEAIAKASQGASKVDESPAPNVGAPLPPAPGASSGAANGAPGASSSEKKTKPQSGAANGAGVGANRSAGQGAGGADAAQKCIPTPKEVQVPVSSVSGGSAGGTKVGGSHTIPANTHVHPNWIFTAPGTYKVSITQTARMKSGKLASATGVLTFVVGGVGNANAGHFDVGTIARPDGIEMAVKDDRHQPASWVSPASLTFGLGSSSRLKAPAGIEFIAKPGQDIWMISSAQVADVPWVGANTMHPDLLNNTTGDVSWRLNSVSGPGALAVFESGNFGQALGRMWFGGAAAPQPGTTTTKMTTKTEYVGKTASGADCVLDAATVKELRAAGNEVAAGSVPSELSHSGAAVNGFGMVALASVLAGLVLTVLASRRGTGAGNAR